MESALDLVTGVTDVLTPELRREHDVLDIMTALRLAHRPDDYAQVGAAQRRFRFEEALVLQLVLARRRAAQRALGARSRAGGGSLLEAFDARLPFELTAGQREIGDLLEEELARDHPMNRLLQGEVGSGKTLVALRAMLRVVDSGGQAVLLAPTEVLAQQHHRSITAMLGDLAQGGMLGGAADGTSVVLLTGSMGKTARDRALQQMSSGEAGIVIGTHALLEQSVELADLGLVVVDEQHRFGVEQRAALTDKAGTPPHVLVMTATPIPRTVAMTVFGDLETSVLSELPAGRAPIQTNVVPARRAARRGSPGCGSGCARRSPPATRRTSCAPASAVTPRRRASRTSSTSTRTARSSPPAAGSPPSRTCTPSSPPARSPASGSRCSTAGCRPTTRTAPCGPSRRARSTSWCPPPSSRSASTSHNATTMVLIDADRFGVSQLHQLRGRVGRGGLPGLCLLVSGAELGIAGPRPARRRRLDHRRLRAEPHRPRAAARG